MNNNFSVFLCATKKDLLQEREAVLNAIRQVGLQHKSMEYFNARSAKSIETCLEEVRNSDILIVIVGNIYGSIVKGMGISFSEAEYKEALKNNKEILVFIRDKDALILAEHVEHDVEKIPLFFKWKSMLENNHSPAYFLDFKDLAVKVTASLSKATKRIESKSVSTKMQDSQSKIRYEKFKPLMIEVLSEMWNDGKLKEISSENIKDMGRGHYGHYSKLKTIWALIERGLKKENHKLTDKGIRFMSDIEKIPRDVQKNPATGEWSAVEGTDWFSNSGWTRRHKPKRK